MSQSGPIVSWGQPWDPRFMLPATSGDRVLVVGQIPHFAADLRRDGVTVLRALSPADVRAGGFVGDVSFTIDGLLVHPSEDFDHVFVPALTRDHRRLPLAELGRVLRPGGGLFLGVPHRLRSRSPVATTAGRGRHALEHAGFTDIEVFGIRYDLDRPRQLVPLDSPALMTWYLASVYRPQPGGDLTGAALLARLVRTRLPVLALGPNGGRSRGLLVPLARSPLPRMIFRALGFVARRRDREC